jgi:hypothetical protein
MASLIPGSGPKNMERGGEAGNRRTGMGAMPDKHV